MDIIIFFSIGLFGSTHCIGMCGGILSALSIAISNKQSNNKKNKYCILYNIGRISMYVIIFIILSIISNLLDKATSEITIKILRIISGFLLVIIGLYLSNFWSGIIYLEKVGLFFWNSISILIKFIVPVNSYIKAYILGLIWGLIPCGLVYTTILLALVNTNFNFSLVLIIFFGIGTLPAMMMTGIIYTKYSFLFLDKNIKYFFGIFIILFGIWNIISGFFFNISSCH